MSTAPASQSLCPSHLLWALGPDNSSPGSSQWEGRSWSPCIFSAGWPLAGLIPLQFLGSSNCSLPRPLGEGVTAAHWCQSQVQHHPSSVTLHCTPSSENPFSGTPFVCLFPAGTLTCVSPTLSPAGLPFTLSSGLGSCPPLSWAEECHFQVLSGARSSSSWEESPRVISTNTKRNDHNFK